MTAKALGNIDPDTDHWTIYVEQLEQFFNANVIEDDKQPF